MTKSLLPAFRSTIECRPCLSIPGSRVIKSRPLLKDQLLSTLEAGLLTTGLLRRDCDFDLF